MVKQQTLGKVAAVGFGAAVASIYAAPELSADVVGINFNPSTVAFTSSSTAVSVEMATDAGSAALGSFGQYNDSVGKSMVFFGGDMASWALASAGQELNASTFAGSTSSINASVSQTGTFYVGFKNSAGGVGWFSVNLGTTGSGSDISYNSGQFGNNGESVTVGAGTAVPEPGSAGLALLALGAVGLRRRRESNN